MSHQNLSKSLLIYQNLSAFFLRYFLGEKIPSAQTQIHFKTKFHSKHSKKILGPGAIFRRLRTNI